MRAALTELGRDASGRSAGLDVKRLQVGGDPPAYRLRIGNWRAAFLLRPDRIEVVRIFHRDEGYGWLDRLYP
jgi:hypothetical protein